MSYDKPLPAGKLSEETNRYWEAAKEERLLIMYCDRCENHIFPPRVVCPFCLSDAIEWKEADGSGTVYTYTIVHHAPSEVWEDIVPYILVIVELDEGAYIFSQLVDCELDDVEIEMPVSVVYDHVTEEVTLPKFEPKLT